MWSNLPTATRTADDRRDAVERGREAEDYVVAMYEREGWRILDRNVLIAGAELDIVAERKGELRFIEVKARVPGDLCGIDAITVDKQRRLTRAADAYLRQYEDTTDLVEEATFDVVIVQLGGCFQHVDRWENAFDARP